MVIAKIITSSVIVLCFIYAGVNLKRNYNVKNIFYENLIDFCEVLKTNINFLTKPVKQIIAENLCRYSKDFVGFLNSYLNNKTEEFNLTYFSEYELNQIKIFFSTLGKSGVEGEISNIESNKTIFENLLNSTKEENKKFGELCLKLSICLGLMFVILFA